MTIGSTLGDDQATVSVHSQGETLVAAMTDKLKVQVKITTHEVQIGKPSDERPAVIKTNCTYSRYPCSIVDDIDIMVNDNSLFVPRSAFADLADLNNAELNLVGKNNILRLGGGDASEAYIVTIEFDAARVKRRILAGATEPKTPLQETIYHVVVIGD